MELTVPNRFKTISMYATPVVILLGGVGFYLFTAVKTSPIPRLKHVSGNVKVSIDGRMETAGSGPRLNPGQEVRTGRSGSAALSYADGSKVTLSHSTKASVGELRNAKLIQLSSGSLDAQVSTQSTGQAMIITTPTASIAVLGTKFTLCHHKQVTELQVHQGVVRLLRSSDKESVSVSAGQTAFVRTKGKILVQGANGEPLAEASPVE